MQLISNNHLFPCSKVALIFFSTLGPILFAVFFCFCFIYFFRKTSFFLLLFCGFTYLSCYVVLTVSDLFGSYPSTICSCSMPIGVRNGTSVLSANIAVALQLFWYKVLHGLQPSLYWTWLLLFKKKLSTVLYGEKPKLHFCIVRFNCMCKLICTQYINALLMFLLRIDEFKHIAILSAFGNNEIQYVHQ